MLSYVCKCKLWVLMVLGLVERTEYFLQSNLLHKEFAMAEDNCLCQSNRPCIIVYQRSSDKLLAFQDKTYCQYTSFSLRKAILKLLVAMARLCFLGWAIHNPGLLQILNNEWYGKEVKDLYRKRQHLLIFSHVMYW